MRHMWIGLLAFAALVISAAFGVSQQQPEPSGSELGSLSVKRQLVGSGSWKSPRNADDHGWQIQLKHMDDDSLSGRLGVVGSPSIGQARIEGQITGTDVYGVIVDDSATQLGTFTGTIAASGAMSGTYTTTDGDSGSWAWDDGIRQRIADAPLASAPTVDTQATDEQSSDAQTTDNQATETIDVPPPGD